ncbi:protein SENESCENCE-ASSOCIATED GENE 21, mitochondrial-like [Bidens hawaiensis]|uniref:protein SENESCENCE-ASSOCIATED GENE 21, mitochondrial-like n=1 Tax=Bidens hawaiensis TaxID=980011 RepID=UPI00404B1F91
MASVNRVSSFIVDQVTVVARRGYATGTQGSISGTVRGSGVAMMKKAGEDSKKSTTWVPDPVTGYYKPESQINHADATKQKKRGN